MSALNILFLSSVEWLLPTLAYIIAILIIYAILSFPAYYVLWPFFAKIKKSISDYIELLKSYIKSKKSERTQIITVIAQSFSKNHELIALKSHDKGYWTSLIKKTSNEIANTRDQIREKTSAMEQLIKSYTKTKQQLEKSEMKDPPDLPELPESKIIAEQKSKIRVARLKVILPSIILLALMIVNTGMLSQILTDLGVVPRNMIFLGIPLSYVFAFILTLVEAGLGVVHGAMKDDADDGKLSIWPTLMFIFAIILSCVEGFFYSRVGQSTELMTIPFTDVPFTQSNLFFLWGFVLVMILFFLGSVVFKAAIIILKGNKTRTLRKEIFRLSKEYEKYNNAIEKSHQNIQDTVELTQTAPNTENAPTNDIRDAEETVHETFKTISELRSTPPDWIKDTDMKLSESDIRHLSNIGGLWAVLTILGAFVMGFTGNYSFSAFFPELSNTFINVLAWGQSIMFFAVGLLWGYNNFVVQPENSGLKIWIWPKISRIFSIILCGGILILYLYLLLSGSLDFVDKAIWLLNLVLGIFLVVAGYHFMPLLSVLRVWLTRIWHFIIYLLEILWISINGILFALVSITEFLFAMLAFPIRVLVGRRKMVQ